MGLSTTIAAKNVSASDGDVVCLHLTGYQPPIRLELFDRNALQTLLGYLIIFPVQNPYLELAPCSVFGHILSCSVLHCLHHQSTITLNPQLFITDLSILYRDIFIAASPHLLRPIISSSSSFQDEDIGIARAVCPSPSPRHLAISQTVQISPQPHQGLSCVPPPCPPEDRHRKDQ